MGVWRVCEAFPSRISPLSSSPSPPSPWGFSPSPPALFSPSSPVSSSISFRTLPAFPEQNRHDHIHWFFYFCSDRSSIDTVPVPTRGSRLTKRCRLSWLTNSPLVNMWAQMLGGGGCGVSASEYSCTRGAQINFGDLTLYLIYGPYTSSFWYFGFAFAEIFVNENWLPAINDTGSRRPRVSVGSVHWKKPTLIAFRYNWLPLKQGEVESIHKARSLQRQ